MLEQQTSRKVDTVGKGSALEKINHIKTSKSKTLGDTDCSAVNAHGMLMSAAHSEICYFELLWKLANCMPQSSL